VTEEGVPKKPFPILLNLMQLCKKQLHVRTFYPGSKKGVLGFVEIQEGRKIKKKEIGELGLLGAKKGPKGGKRTISSRPYWPLMNVRLVGVRERLRERREQGEVPTSQPRSRED